MQMWTPRQCDWDKLQEARQVLDRENACCFEVHVSLHDCPGGAKAGARR